jgi:hypothetical protein
MNIKTLAILLAALVLSAVVVLAADNNLTGIAKPNEVSPVNLSNLNKADPPMDLSAFTGPFFTTVDIKDNGCPYGLDCGGMGDSGGDAGAAAPT